MKTVKIFFTTLLFSFIYRPFLLKAQEGGMQTENLEVQDSSYLEQEFMADAAMQSSGTGNTVIIIAAVIMLMAVSAYLILKSRKNTAR